MDFEWDENKSDACFGERGFDFEYAARAFLDPHRLVRTDTRRDYGERRYQLVAAIDARVFVVAYTMRGDVIRIISARKANKREVYAYENATHED